MDHTCGFRYQTVEQIPMCAWQIQGTVYDNATDAKFAAARMFTLNTIKGVAVKKVSSGWALLYCTNTLPK